MRYSSALILLFTFLTCLYSCNKKEKVLKEDLKSSLKGTWFSNKIKYYDLLNGTSLLSANYLDLQPPTKTNELDVLPAQITFEDQGTYTSLTHRNGLHFATFGNVKSPDFRYAGTWFINESNLHFDKGVSEFSGASSHVMTILKLTNDSLILETSDPQAIYEWAYYNEGARAFLIDLQNVENSCSRSGPDRFGGKELAATYALYKGYLEAVKNEPITFNPFGIGARKGGSDIFDRTYKVLQPQVPITDSCYKANFNTNFNLGFNQAKSQLSTYKFRSQKLTFFFSRTPNPQDIE